MTARVLSSVADVPWAVWLLWAGLAAAAIALAALARSPWGQAKPLRKCAVLSALVHVVLIGCVSSFSMMSSKPLPQREQFICISLDMPGVSTGTPDPATVEPSAQQGAASAREFAEAEEVPSQPAAMPIPAPPTTSAAEQAADAARPGGATDMTEANPLAEAAEARPTSLTAKSSATDEPPGDAPVPSSSAGAPAAPEHLASPLPAAAAVATVHVRAVHAVPELYQQRLADNRDELAARHGGNHQTEAAVTAALKWLAANQDDDGRWNPRRHGAGVERMIDGQDRLGAGSQADTGITALALLVFLAAGHTQSTTPYGHCVERGLNHLVSVQKANGSLSGKAAVFEAMYCHAMATIALAEAYGMTGDARYAAPTRAAAAYCLAAQNPVTGGWRYTPGDSGDTSQLGWQLLALKSAALAGVRVPPDTWQRAARYLETVSYGRAGGLAAYRPGEQVSRSMTAEALVCRLLVGLEPASTAAEEAAEFLLSDLPGGGHPNFYYWYYGTLAMYQVQGPAWQRWNDALQKTLLASQRDTGPAAGSWDPLCIWGCYGGRVYSTALAALSLEVYYRFLPLYVAARRDVAGPP